MRVRDTVGLLLALSRVLGVSKMALPPQYVLTLVGNKPNRGLRTAAPHYRPSFRMDECSSKHSPKFRQKSGSFLWILYFFVIGHFHSRFRPRFFV